MVTVVTDKIKTNLIKKNAKTETKQKQNKENREQRETNKK